MNGFKKLVRLNLKVFGDGIGCTVHNKLKKIYVKTPVDTRGEDHNSKVFNGQEQ
jgi:hypothetical protein